MIQGFLVGYPSIFFAAFFSGGSRQSPVFCAQAPGFGLPPDAGMMGQMFMPAGPVNWGPTLWPFVSGEQFNAALMPPSPAAFAMANLMAAMMGGAASVNVMPPAAATVEEPMPKPKGKPKGKAKPKAKAKGKAKAKPAPKKTVSKKK